jgi:hypothetical protein
MSKQSVMKAYNRRGENTLRSLNFITLIAMDEFLSLMKRKRQSLNCNSVVISYNFVSLYFKIERTQNRVGNLLDVRGFVNTVTKILF